MRITVTKVKALNPCQSRFDNFVQQNPNFKGSVEDFLSLENITYSDKTWVCVRLMTKNQRFFWARSCAYSVLEIFESQRPNDSSVRDLLDYLGTLDDVENLTAEQLSEIRRLRADASDTAAYAASAAACSAYAAYASDTAAYAASAAAAAYAAYASDAAYAASAAAAYAAYATHAAGKEQEDFNLIILAAIMQMDI